MPHGMEPPTEASVHAQIARICDSPGFRAAPKLARLLRFLADRTLAGGDRQLGQRLIAEQVIGDGQRTTSSAGVAARMQVGRLRRHLEAYYATEGRDDPIRIEVPKRNYLLRFVPGGASARTASPRAVERTTLAVIEFAGVGLGDDRAWVPMTLTRELIVALDPFHGVAVWGPLPQATAGRPTVRTADFILVGDVHVEAAGLRVVVRLLDGRSSLQCWARSLSVPLAAAGTLPTGGLACFDTVADELADETGIIACEAMRASAARATDTLSVREAALAHWRFLMTGGADELLRGRAAAAAVAEAVPDSAVALTVDASTRLTAYLSDPSPQARCPREPLDLLERAVSLAPGDAWVQAHLGFARWIGRETIGLEGICWTLDGRPGSGSFRGIVGSLMSVSMIDMERGEALLAESLARAPAPLYWFCHHAALCGFRRGDLAAMRNALARIVVRTDPFSLVMRTVLATAEGDMETARGLAAAVLETFPAFADAGEAMMRRLLHDDHVDAIAATLEPLGLGWFE